MKCTQDIVIHLSDQSFVVAFASSDLLDGSHRKHDFQIANTHQNFHSITWQLALRARSHIDALLDVIKATRMVYFS